MGLEHWIPYYSAQKVIIENQKSEVELSREHFIGQFALLNN